MALPMLLAWMKQWHELTTHGVNARDVGPFVFIAVQTTPGQIFQNRRATMLLGDDVINLEWKGVTRSRQMAVFTPILRDLPKLLQYPALHLNQCVFDLRATDSDRRAFDWRMPNI
jgi:hypothetical protein